MARRKNWPFRLQRREKDDVRGQGVAGARWRLGLWRKSTKLRSPHNKSAQDWDSNAFFTCAHRTDCSRKFVYRRPTWQSINGLLYSAYSDQLPLRGCATIQS